MSEETKIRPTKKQRELLSFIELFIAEHGYSPSYREIMAGTGHNSVATVSVHIDNLIKRGHLKKRENSARSLELTMSAISPEKVPVKQLNQSETKWLVEKVEAFFKDAELTATLKQSEIDNLYVLIGALKVLGLDGAAQSFIPRLALLKSKTKSGIGNMYA